MTPAQNLGLRLRHARKQRGYTHKQVGERLHMNKQPIGRMESGDRGVLALELVELAEMYDYPLEWFFWEGEPGATVKARGTE